MGGLPDPTGLEDGTALIKVGSEWKAQSGYGYEEEELISVVDESVTVFDDDGDIYGVFTNTFNLIVGNEYIVNFNGTEYTALCEYNELMGYSTIGGPSPYTGLDFSEYPFVIIDDGYDVEICTETEGIYSIEISTTSSSVTTIDPKFIPQSGNEFVVNITATPDDDDIYHYTCDKTYEQIVDSINNEKLVIYRLHSDSGNFYAVHSILQREGSDEFIELSFIRPSDSSMGFNFIFISSDDSVTGDNYWFPLTH